MQEPRYPMLLKPAYFSFFWGGDRLSGRYHKTEGEYPVAETWEIADYEGGPIIQNGALAGKTLQAALREQPALAGSRAAHFEEFPLIAKLVDARYDLSIQVHTDDDYAAKTYGGHGKTEMWYVLDCQPGASLFFGFEHETTPEAVREAIANDTLPELLHRVPVKPGDALFTPPGVVHGIGEGVAVVEIQQASVKSTYRLYDFGRKDAQGNLRPLHIDQALEIAQLCPAGPQPVQPVCDHGSYTDRTLASCAYFQVHDLQIVRPASLQVGEESFLGLLCTDGPAVLCCDGQTLTLRRGDTAFLPAGLGEVQVQSCCGLLAIGL